MTLLWVLVAAAFHEFGHYLTARLLGYRCKGFAHLPATVGVGVVVPEGKRLSPREDLFIALAGPYFSLLLGVSFLQNVPDLAIVSLAIGLLNLLPFLRGSDGWRVWQVAMGRGTIRNLRGEG